MGKYDKFICTTLHKRDRLPGPTPEQRDQLASEGLRISMEHVLWIDSDVIPGAYYSEATWIWPQSYPGQITAEELAKRFTSANPMFPHPHDFPELLSWWGSDPDHPEDYSEMSMIMGDEEIRLERGFVAYIPTGMMHMPKRIPDGKVSSKPVNHWTFGPGVYLREPNVHKTAENAQHDEPQKEYKTIPGKKDNLKYIIFDGDQKNVKKPDYMCELDPRFFRHMAYIDDTIIPDAEIGCDTMYLLPGEGSKEGQIIMNAHTLPHGCSIAITAMNYDDITQLAAEAELWIGGEKHIIHKSFGAYIPPNVEQGPLIVRNITKQLFVMLAFPVGAGMQKYTGG
jgi:hypothetical protein